MPDKKNIRVRFAPSPTGPLHIGGVRTALFNYLFARHHGGTFILRIEDTDQTRYVDFAEDYIVESLAWAGITIDEGHTAGGDYGPYRQSERKAIYRQYAEQLVNDGFAYYAFDTPQELEAMRERLTQAKSTTRQYDSHTRMTMRNSLTLSEDEVKKLLDAGTKYVVRLKTPENETISFHDIIRGEVSFNTSQLDDKVLFKSDGMPTYHLANVVDDRLMKISHVIRGEEWLPSTPLHLLLYRYLGWENERPEFAHLPLILKPNGNGKLSKRDGDMLGFPVYPLDWVDAKSGEVYSGFRENGYFPEAFINMLAFLGWNPGTEQEFFTMDELIAAFTMDRVGKSGSKFDPEKAKWYNHQYFLLKDSTDLLPIFEQEIKTHNILDFSSEKLLKIVELIKSRINFTTEFWDWAFYFFESPKTYEEKAVKKFWKGDAPKYLADTLTIFENNKNLPTTEIEMLVKQYIEENQLGFGKVFNAIRVAISGTSKGPGIFEIIEIIGVEETILRMKAGLEFLTHFIQAKTQ